MKEFVIFTGASESLSRMVQEELFRRGFGWVFSGASYFKHGGTIRVDADGKLYNETAVHQNRFDLTTQPLTVLLDFLDAKPVEKSLGQICCEVLNEANAHYWSGIHKERRDRYEQAAKAVAEEAARRAAK